MTLSALLQKARRRVFTHLLLDKGALAATIGLGGAVILLLVGTLILDWPAIAALVVVSLGIGVYQIRKSVPSTYQIAQRIDRRLELADALSTASYFRDHPKSGYEAVCELQCRGAENLATAVDLQAALPLPRPRYLYPAAALLLIVAGLFTLRFAVLGTLDLKPSLIDMAVDTFFTTPPDELRAKALRPDIRPNAFDPTQPDTPPSPDDPTFNLPEDTQDATDLMKGDSNKDGEKDQGEKGLDNSKQEGENKGDEQGDPQSQKDGKEGESKEGDSSESNQDDRSMLDKLRDAVENLMNKMNPKESNAKNAKNSPGKQQKGEKGEKGQKGDDKGERAEGQPQSESGEQGEQSEEAKSSEGPGAKPSEDAKSGAGVNDGDKAIQDAKMLEAMGKLSELLGQRANEVSGQMMIEVGNTKQQLRTAFTQQQAGHAESGSEIHRDEVPLIHQQFIERYFQEIRKGTQGPAKVPAQPAKQPAQ